MLPLDYNLHTLGWRAFQDLSAVVLQRVLGQTFHAFADSNDGGRDGAFHGTWATPGDAPQPEVAALAAGRATVAQCKFSGQATGTLTPSMLADEISKVELLHQQGLCDAYLLLTNLRVTGRTEAWVAEECARVGVDASLVLDGRWICQQIETRPDLRRYVPRVYGLGDLGKILDDRRLRQAEALLARLRPDLATFVPTAAYRRAADAVADYGFVLLLGEPACGKTTIAATLALAALDNWKCGVRRVDSAEELVAAWDPDDPDQLFWVDDAFGSIRHNPELTDGWTRRMDQVMTAIERGAKVVLTSRDYIYRDARPYLKEYVHTRLRERQVVVDVTELTPTERGQILYNHLKAGDQSADTLNRWRPHLRAAANVERFQPEVARRLAYTAFTESAQLASRDALLRWFDRPVSFLADVLRQLDPAARAALACVYMAGDELSAPIELTPRLSDAITRLGSSPAEVLSAFGPADGTFLQLSQSSDGDPVWRFRHPTIREGFAAVVAEEANAVGVFVDGLAPDELVEQLDCGGERARGTFVRVPPSLYDRVVPKVPVPSRTATKWSNPTAWFLQYRCSDEFLRQWASHHAEDLPRLATFGMYIGAMWEPGVLVRLQAAEALPESVRAAAAAQLAEHALDFDSGWLDPGVVTLLTADERASILDRIREEVIPDLRERIDQAGEGWDDDVEPAQRYDEARTAIRQYRDAFADDASVQDALADADAYIDERVEYAHEDYRPRLASPLAAAAPGALSDRDEFDDVADGHH
ncbi:nSTAND3 domain-containing NTPase [Cellulomonas sp. P4]|uniref:nSTAND3 domain-containing NTPase n=1 Tax=Cellulomonas sp. P4 TaxID=3142533 RepID=UPI0031BA2BBF